MRFSVFKKVLFSAAGRPDKRRDLAGHNIHINALQGFKITVVQCQIFGLNDGCLFHKPVLLSVFLAAFARTARAARLMTSTRHRSKASNGPGYVEVAFLKSQHVQGHGKGGAAAAVGGNDVVRHDFSKTGCKQKRCAFAHDAADGKNTAGDDAVHAGWQDDGADHVPFGGTQPKRTSR